MTRLRRIRRGVQLAVLGGLVAVGLLAAARLDVVRGTLCCIGTRETPLVACPVGALQVTVASRELHPGLLLAALPLTLAALVVGRAFCSWVCPQGLASELADGARAHAVPRPDSPARTRRGRALALTALAAALLAPLALGYPALCVICPIGIVCRGVVSATGAGALSGELVVVGAILLAEAFVARRGWCKYLCPVGAFYGLLARPWSLRPSREGHACLGCHTCERDCSMGNSPLRGQVGSTCTVCGDCLAVCPGSAIHLQAGPPARPRRRELPVAGQASSGGEH